MHIVSSIGDTFLLVNFWFCPLVLYTLLSDKILMAMIKMMMMKKKKKMMMIMHHNYCRELC